ncbi:MAG TPA: ATP-binding cassette domain-containing protein [Micromonosporaceae bacterium]|nr:ATP-binding cassette domain-containing protein [Micromonosporaceae bacterium]
MAVRDLSLKIAHGEVVGLLGQNGAGKTVTIKCLVGLLRPTSGTVRVLGHDPAHRRRELLEQVSMVAGHRSQMVWDVPVLDTFRMHKDVYGIGDIAYRQRLEELADLLDLEPLLDTSVRRLSLGQRMRCELAVALLHAPRTVFLDEPTLGLDVVAQQRLRRFLRDYNDRHGAAMLVTSHYMTDLEVLTDRVILLEAGSAHYEGTLADLVASAAPYRYLRLTLREPVSEEDAAALGDVEEVNGARVTCRVPRHKVSEVAARALAQWPVVDISIEEPPTEAIIAAMLSAGAGAGDAAGARAGDE